VIPGEFQELRLLETIDQPADIRPVERPGAHGTGLAGRDQRAGPQEIRRVGCRGAAGELGLGMAHRVEIALAHEDTVVGSDQNGAEGMMPMRRRLARDGVGGSEMGEHLIAGHGKILLQRLNCSHRKSSLMREIRPAEISR